MSATLCLGDNSPEWLTLNRAMMDQPKGPSMLRMLVVLAIALLVASAIAYGIINQYFHH